MFSQVTGSRQQVISSAGAVARIARGSSSLDARLESHFETHVQRFRQSFQHSQSRNGPAGLESSDRGLSHARCLRQLGLAPTSALTKLPNGTPEFERQPRSVVRLGRTRLSHPPLTHRGPTATFAHDLAFLIDNLMRLVNASHQRPARSVDLPLIPHADLVEDR
jgi:hypothetical protein